MVNVELNLKQLMNLYDSNLMTIEDFKKHGEAFSKEEILKFLIEVVELGRTTENEEEEDSENTNLDNDLF